MINLLVIHCSATPPSMDIGVEDIRQWHLERGWSDIGYHYIIDRNGGSYKGRDLDNDGDVEDETGAHAYGFNKNSLSICMVGGVDEDGNPECNFTRRQWGALNVLVTNISNRHHLTKAQIKGHNELPGVDKACPCFSVKGWLSDSLDA